MRELNFKLHNKNVRVHVWGHENDDTVIFLHGLGGASLSCIEIANMIENKYKVISIDLPGHGYTDILEKTNFEVPNLTKWLNTVISSLVSDQHHIIGHSWGAELALHYIVNYPKYVDKVILLDGGYHDKTITNNYFKELNEKDDSQKRISSMQEEIEFYQNDFDGFKFKNYQDAVQSEFQYYKRQNDYLKSALEYLIRYDGSNYRWHANGTAATNAILSMYKHPSREINNLIKDNVLLLHCSLQTPSEWTTLRKMLINDLKSRTKIKTHEIPNSGHMVHYDNPDYVVKYTLEFLK